MTERHWQRCVEVALEYECDLEVTSEEAGRFYCVAEFGV